MSLSSTVLSTSQPGAEALLGNKMNPESIYFSFAAHELVKRT